MNYLEWNNAIGKWFFNEEKAEKEVYLFISKQDIIRIGKDNGLNGKDEEIFIDYIQAIKNSIPAEKKDWNILQCVHYIYFLQKELEEKSSEQLEYPLYIGYLSLFVLPLVEKRSLNLRADAYYPPVRNFLRKYELPLLPNQNETFNWNRIWQDLEEWSILKKNTELGYFELHPFKNKNWVYVGKPLSQSIFPIQAIRKLPKFFEISGLVPGEEIDNNTFRNLLITNGERYLGLSSKVLNVIGDSENELGHSIISVVIRNYQGWTGVTDEFDSDTETIKKGNVIAQLRLCIEGDKVRGFKTYYRLYTKLDFPEDLTFINDGQKYECHQVGKGWSNQLFLPFSEEIELQDNLNKWKAKFPEKDVRLLINGKNFHLSGWVEVPFMITSRMLILARKEQSDSIEEWGDCFSEGDFKKIPVIGINKGYVLYEMCNPPFGHPDILVLQFKSNKRIIMVGGIKIGIRTWLKDLPPAVELENGCGTEKVYLIYEDSNKKIPLTRRDIDQPIWELPQDIKINKGFHIKIEGDEEKGVQSKNYIVDSKGKVDLLNEAKLPSRDKYGQVIRREENNSFVVGINFKTVDRDTRDKFSKRQIPYNHCFTPINSSGKYSCIVSDSINEYDNMLITFLTVKGESNVKDYYEAFESVYEERFSPEEIECHSIEPSKLKRWSLNYLDYMGILDYDYSTKKIIVNPPQLILLPTTSGRKALLIGGRTQELIKKITTEIANEGLYLTLEPQDESLTPFLLPQTVTIEGYDDTSGSNVESKIRKVAVACSLLFEEKNLPQLGLAEFSGNIDEYFGKLIPDERFDDFGWPAWIFDENKLRFVHIETKHIDKSFSLVEYRRTEYDYKHRFWMNGQAHDVNKNWGRYIVLNHYQKEVIFYNRNQKNVAVPAALPLPRLISKSIILCSGKAPKRRLLEIEGIKTWFNIYENIFSIFSYNFLKEKLNQTQIETKIEL